MKHFRFYKALSIGRPLFDSLMKKPLCGHVVGIYNNSCNILGYDGRMINLAVPLVGNSPFSIIIQSSYPFTLINPQMIVCADHHSLTIGNKILIKLKESEFWNPKLLEYGSPFNLNISIVQLLNKYRKWEKVENKFFYNKTLKDHLVLGATALETALKNGNSCKNAVRSLAGLGSGLTPSGDDYLLGVLASLWFTRQKSSIEKIALYACNRTTFLSAAYLNAASKGEFSESWHQLLKNIVSNDSSIASDSIIKFSKIGASSGRDSLAGFATHFLQPRLNSEFDL